MASVKYNLKNRNSKSKSLIFACVYYEGKTLKLSTKQKIQPEFWDFSKQRARVVASRGHHSDINLFLDSLVVIINKAHLEFQRENITPSKNQLKNKINLLKSGKVTLMKFIDTFVKSRKSKMSHNTIKRYISCKNHLIAYSKKRRKTIDFADIDISFYNDWLDYFYTDLDSSVNTAGKNISVLKAILSEATERGINKNTTFLSSRFKTPYFATDYIYLTLSELDVLYRYKAPIKRLERVRDMFLIGCYTGLRFSDFSEIKPANIQTISHNGKKVEVIKLRTQKTKTEIVVPLNKKVKKILKKYLVNSELNLPSISNQKMNQYLKELCRDAGITKHVEVLKSVSGQPVRKTMAKCDLVITHSGRSSFVSNAVLSGISDKAIMQMTGISSRTTLQRYNRLSVVENAIYISNNPLFG